MSGTVAAVVQRLLPLVGWAGSCFAEGKPCVCTFRGAQLCASFSDDCLCSAALVCFGAGTLGAVCQLAGDECAGTSGDLES